MRIAEVVGRVTLSRMHPALRGSRFVLAYPMPREAIMDGSPNRGEELVAYDALGAGPGSIVALGESREAANPFGKVKTPIDAYVACLIDQFNL